MRDGDGDGDLAEGDPVYDEPEERRGARRTMECRYCGGFCGGFEFSPPSLLSHPLCRSLLSSCVTGPTVLLFLLLCSPRGRLLPFLRTSVISVGSILAGFSFVIEATEDVLSAVDTFGNDTGHETFLNSWGDGIL